MSKINQVSKDWVYTHIIVPVMESGHGGFWTFELHRYYEQTGLDSIYADIFRFAKENGIEAAQATLRDKDRNYISTL